MKIFKKVCQSLMNKNEEVGKKADNFCLDYAFLGIEIDILVDNTGYCVRITDSLKLVVYMFRCPITGY